jgi:hypothetical protein
MSVPDPSVVDWVPLGGGGAAGSVELDYVTLPADTGNITAISSGSMVLILQSNPIVCDGSRICIETMLQGMTMGTAPVLIFYNYYRDANPSGPVSGTSLGSTYRNYAVSSRVSDRTVIYDTPPPGTHTYSVKAWVSGATGGINITARGGVSNAAQADSFMRISHALGLPGPMGPQGDPGVPGSGFTEIRKSVDESVASNINIQDDDVLFFQTVSGVTYEIEMVIIYSSPLGAGTPDFKFDVSEDATARGGIFWEYWDINDSWGTSTRSTIAGQTTTPGTAAIKRACTGYGHHVGGGGILKFRWAQNVSGANPTIVHAGSVLRYRAIT